MEIFFNHRLHKELWNWLAQNPEKSKEDWPGWKRYGYEKEEMGNYHFCFACKAVNHSVLSDSNLLCDFCPLDWGESKYCYNGGYYSRYESAIFNDNIKDAKFCAEKIADLQIAKNCIIKEYKDIIIINDDDNDNDNAENSEENSEMIDAIFVKNGKAQEVKIDREKCFSLLDGPEDYFPDTIELVNNVKLYYFHDNDIDNFGIKGNFLLMKEGEEDVLSLTKEDKELIMLVIKNDKPIELLANQDYDPDANDDEYDDD